MVGLGCGNGMLLTAFHSGLSFGRLEREGVGLGYGVN